MKRFLILLLLLATPAIAQNDPGHDTLYIEQSGDSELSGNLNITQDLKVAQRIFSDFLDVRGDGTTSGSTNRIIGTSTNLLIESSGNIILNDQLGTTNTLHVGYTGDSVDANITGDLIVAGTGTIGTGTICTTTNGLCASSGSGSGGGWTNTSTLVSLADASDNVSAGIFYIDNTNSRIGINTTTPAANLQVNGTLRFNTFTSCTALETDSSGNLVCGTDDGGGSSGGGWTNTTTLISSVIGSNITMDNGVMYVDATNNKVGINIEQPTHELTVSGNVNITGSLMINNSNGTSQCLQINPDGSISGTGTGCGVNNNLQHTFTGLHLRTSPDNDKENEIVTLIHADAIILSDGTKENNWNNKEANISKTGAGGKLTGVSEEASKWYRILAIYDQDTDTQAIVLDNATKHTNDQQHVIQNGAENFRDATARTKLAQGFQVSTAGEVKFIDLSVNKVAGSPTGNIWITIESDSSGDPSGTVLATSDKLDLSKLPNAVGDYYVRFAFRSPTTVSTSTQYHIVLNADNTIDGVNYLRWVGGTADTYANGAGKQYSGSTWSATATYVDLNFKLYIETITASANPTLPAGYDSWAHIGYVYNDASSNFKPFVAQDRVVRMTRESLGSTTKTDPVLTDISAYVPPGKVEPLMSAYSSGGQTIMYVGMVPDGFDQNRVSDMQIVTESADGQPMPLAGAGGMTETQAIYMSVLSWTGNFQIQGYEWLPSDNLQGPGGNPSTQWTASGSNLYYNDGTISIGQASAGEKLHVNGSINVTTGNDICIEGGNCLSTVASTGGNSSMGGGWTNTTTVVSLNDANDNISAGVFYVDNTNNKIGIRTASPTQELHVNGSVNITGTIYGDGSNLTGISTATTNISLLHGANTSDTTQDIPVQVTSSGELKLSIAEGLSTGWHDQGTSVVLTTSTDKVGIGTTSPTTTLHVEGDLNVTGTTYGTFGAMTLLHQDSGTSTSTVATTVSSVAISGLTAKDTLFIFITMGSTTQATAAPLLYHVTDGAQIVNIYANDPLAANTRASGQVHMVQGQSGATSYQGLSFIPAKQATIDYTATASWTGSWTLGLRHGGVTSGGTFDYVWSVYKLAGQ